jgi:hypothetical protein
MHIHTYLSIVLGDYWLGDIFKNSCYDISLRLIKNIYVYILRFTVKQHNFNLTNIKSTPERFYDKTCKFTHFEWNAQHEIA